MRFIEDPNGIVHIYKKPIPGIIYVVGSDIAEGLEDGDYSTAFVLDNNFEHVASIHCHMDVDLFAERLVCLASYYNNALLAWEVNNMGAAITSNIKKLGYNFVYLREIIDKNQVDITLKMGWRTDIRTKHLMISELISAVRDDAIKIKDVELLRELITLNYDETGNINLNGKDRTVAACIAIQALKQAPIQNFKAQYNTDEDKPPTFESFQQRMKRLGRKTSDSYFS